MLCSVVEEDVRCRVWLSGWLDRGVYILPEMHVNLALFVRFAVDRGGARLYDFLQMLCIPAWGSVPSHAFRHIIWARNLLDDDDTESALIAREVMDMTTGNLGPAASGVLDRKMATYSHVQYNGTSPVGVDKAIAQYVDGSPARLVMAAIRRMAFAFLQQGEDGVDADSLVSCLYPVFGATKVRRLMHTVNSGGVGEFLTFADVLGMVGLCSDVSHLRVFKFLPSVTFRCGGANMVEAAKKTWEVTRTVVELSKDDGRRRGEIVPHIITKADASDVRLIELLPVLKLPQHRFAVSVHGLHASMHSGLVTAMVGDCCREITLARTSVVRAHEFLVLAMKSINGEATPRSRSVRKLTLHMTARDANESHHARRALLKLVLRMFPCLTTLDVSGPNKKSVTDDPHLDEILASTARACYVGYDYPVYDSLKILRWDLGETNGNFFLQFLTGFKRLEKCSIGENSTLWEERRSNIVRAMAMKSTQEILALEVYGSISCELPHIGSLLMRVESTSDIVLPTIKPSTMLTVEAHEGKQSDLAVLKRTHPRLAVRIYKCADMDTFPDRNGRKRPRGPGFYDYRHVVSSSKRR